MNGNGFEAAAFSRCGGREAWQVHSGGKATTSGAQQIVRKLTVELLGTYKRCNPAFKYSLSFNPRRQLTKPSEPAGNSGMDNASRDLIVSVGDVFQGQFAWAYEAKDLLGQGTFGQVLRCTTEKGDGVALKVIKNHAAYYHQARVEVGILRELMRSADPNDEAHIIRMLDCFVYHGHLCIVFEQLQINLYELIRQNNFHGLSLNLVRTFASQVLRALALLRRWRVVHCDVKPENILLASLETGEVKLIDFGSACYEGKTVYTYIQSRFYRSPEVVLGSLYGCPIDTWSAGCVAAELFFGVPLFAAPSEHNLLHRITETTGPLPAPLIEHGSKAHKYYVQDTEHGSWRLVGPKEFEQIHGAYPAQGKRYFKHSKLPDLVHAVTYRRTSDEAARREYDRRNSFVNFLSALLEPHPSKRLTPDQALKHPFLSGQRMHQPFQPPHAEARAIPPRAAQHQQASFSSARSMPMPIDSAAGYLEPYGGASPSSSAAAAAMAAVAAANHSGVELTAAPASPYVSNGFVAPPYSPKSNSGSGSELSTTSQGYTYGPLRSPRTPSGMESLARSAGSSLGSSAKRQRGESHPLNAESFTPTQRNPLASSGSPNPADWDPCYSDAQLVQGEPADTGLPETLSEFIGTSAFPPGPPQPPPDHSALFPEEVLPAHSAPSADSQQHPLGPQRQSESRHRSALTMALHQQRQQSALPSGTEHDGAEAEVDMGNEG